MKKKRSWQEKLQDSKGLPKIVAVGGRMTKRFGDGTFVIPAPLEVDALMKRIPKGKLTTIDEMRASLAKAHGTDHACPMTTGIFAWIAANAADEAERLGKKRVTPYWRTLKSNGELNLKYPGGPANLIARLKQEGHAVTQRGKRHFVADYERSLAGI